MTWGMGDDDDLFRKTVGPVRPVRGGDQRPPSRSAQSGSRRRATSLAETATGHADDRSEESCNTGTREADSFLRAGQQQRTLKKLDGGRFVAQASLDLHGLTREPARRLLLDFVDECLATGLTHIRVVHGKGHRSQEQPVLKPLVMACLTHHPAVLAYRPAGPADGGTGATRVLLKRRGHS